MNRLDNINCQLQSTLITTKNPDDVVICSAVRTAITKAKKGHFKDTAP
jgi:acetyl-CoA acyltransferase 1